MITNRRTFLFSILRERKKSDISNFSFFFLCPCFFFFFFLYFFINFIFYYFLRLNLGNKKLCMCDIYRTFLLFAYFCFLVRAFFLLLFFYIFIFIYIYFCLYITSSVITRILPSHLVSVAVFVFVCLSVHQLVCHHLSRLLFFEWWTNTPIPMQVILFRL